MTKITAVFFLLIFFAITASAADDKFEVASAENGPFFHKRSVAFTPVVSEKYEYYEIKGDCEKELWNEMKQNGPLWSDGKKYEALTSWHVKWEYGYDCTPKGCRTDSFTANVEIVFRYPKWVQTNTLPRPLVEKWDGYMKNLITHENGHRDIAVEAAAELVRAVAELPPAPSCAHLDQNVHALCRTHMQKLIADENEYDEATGHGIQQGAVFP